uniref:Strictosidine synthase conserved region domain-containing protein n=1 Tax=Oryza punctata TaxID=4537 RepID=A0A0E0LRT8_ORYPU
MARRRRGFPASTLLLLLVSCLLVFLGAAQQLQVKTSHAQFAFHLPLPDGVTGAESLAFDTANHGPYTGVSDGRVLRWGGAAAGWTTFAHHQDYRKIPMCTTPVAPPEETESMCGRPLGLAFHNETGDLYIADAYKGLMRVGPGGGEAEVLAAGADGVPFNFVNGIDVDQATGDVYFTDSSTTYPRRFNSEIMMNADATARLLKYDAATKQVAVLRAGLPYANGVAVSHGGEHVVVAHTVPCQAFRYWIKGAKAGEYELFADLPGYPDNVRRDAKGGYWVALNQEKVRLDAAAAVVPPAKHLVGVRLNGDGVEVEELTAAKGVTLSEVVEKGGKLWLGSVELDFIGLMQ